MKINRSKTRLKLRTEIENLGCELPHTDIAEVIKWLVEKKRELELRGYSELTLNSETGGYDCPNDFVIRGNHEETDKEFERRMKDIADEKRIETFKHHEHINHITMEARKLGLIK